MGGNISIHALLAESDWPFRHNADTKAFLSTLSLRRATDNAAASATAAAISIHALLAESDRRAVQMQQPRVQFLSTLSLRRATLTQAQYDNAKSISIHALLAESDGRPQCAGRQDGNFYPRSPCGERRVLAATLPENRHFYPRSPCGERRLDVTIIGRTWDISIHALLAESDTIRL